MKTKADSALLSNPNEKEKGAAGWSFLYLLFGGGIFGAIVIFVVLKFIGQ